MFKFNDIEIIANYNVRHILLRYFISSENSEICFSLESLSLQNILEYFPLAEVAIRTFPRTAPHYTYLFNGGGEGVE